MSQRAPGVERDRRDPARAYCHSHSCGSRLPAPIGRRRAHLQIETPGHGLLAQPSGYAPPCQSLRKLRSSAGFVACGVENFLNSELGNLDTHRLTVSRRNRRFRWHLVLMKAARGIISTGIGRRPQRRRCLQSQCLDAKLEVSAIDADHACGCSRQRFRGAISTSCWPNVFHSCEKPASGCGGHPASSCQGAS